MLRGAFTDPDGNTLTITKTDVELTDTARVAGLKYAAVDCNALTTLAVDEIETFASGSTAVRYDSMSGQFVYNWKTPAAGCYTVTTYLDDVKDPAKPLSGSTIIANVKLR